MPLFERSEFLSRLRLVKRAMADRDIDLLLVASPANQNWLTGYDGWSFYTPQMVVVAADLDEPVWIGRKMDAVGAKFTAYLAAENVVPYPDRFVGSDSLHPMDFVADTLIAMGLEKGRIGVETDDYYYTARWDHILRARLDKARFEDAFLLVNRCRMVKSERELTYMRQAGQIATAAQRAAFEAAEPGVRQCDVMAEVYRVTTSGLPEFGGTFPCKPPNAMANEMCSAPHLSWTDDPLAEGDIFYIELGGVRHRYHSPLSRCIYLGTPPDELGRLSDVIAEGLEAVLAAVRPGATCGELAEAWQRVITRHGVEKDSRIGYPVGLGYPPTWGELTASLRIGDMTVLEAGMTFHCIPSIWRESYGMTISETFAVTGTGAECFAQSPRRLLVKQ
ncbi:MAG: M24 family metallopeptidase [Paracoccus sp. (in: a-proteobacteria)]|jgi:Xaa-Pro aminopeptidase|uniref:M24 family metallopeptidase n=1 Tax=unclassified Paracoccus (in: a-proteobacteria) TaxID=2688777 RepID=UPI000C66BECD|nr:MULTISPECIES: Xaa-Pro peptidase family protein [unclassified Paracoccus (in: a-proteobacteria)]MAN56976.1 ectoine hydrolase DoeA [Paracoccus sp. (in: a-proteobacteria)]MBA49043.1 ectoine hydrolase DoeA [Paracoccus sp. (in: a-proteobacteria)]|tara:strand:+ start:216 stop:1388 length:1173 start_codon:yes stop_codon:yes gene_type:complete